jgi:diadenosine tetraphosphate (Ap4A) HIT family hydrolase
MGTAMNSLSQAKEQGIAPWTELVSENAHMAVYSDAYPVTPGHLLFVPINNTDENILVCMGAALLQGQQMVAAGQCDGFNVGLNMGRAAGQTVMYPHVHLISRRQGDCADPVGGVRAVVAGQANYRSSSYTNPNN